MWQVFVHHLWGWEMCFLFCIWKCSANTLPSLIPDISFNRMQKARINTRSVTAINSMWPLKDRLARVLGSVEQSDFHLQF